VPTLRVSVVVEVASAGLRIELLSSVVVVELCTAGSLLSSGAQAEMDTNVAMARNGTMSFFIISIGV
jgi:hypothetical protein